MANAALQVPISFEAKTRQDVTKKLLEIQSKEGGKVSIISIVYDTDAQAFVCFYYSLKGYGSSMSGF